MRVTRCHSALVISRKVWPPRLETPALAKQPSTWPNSSSVRAKAASTAASSPTSHCSARIFRPVAFSVSAAAAFFATLVPQIAMSAPACAMAWAMPRPMPLLPPVTSATLPVRSNGLYATCPLLQTFRESIVTAIRRFGKLAAAKFLARLAATGRPGHDPDCRQQRRPSYQPAEDRQWLAHHIHRPEPQHPEGGRSGAAVRGALSDGVPGGKTGGRRGASAFPSGGPVPGCRPGFRPPGPARRRRHRRALHGCLFRLRSYRRL